MNIFIVRTRFVLSIENSVGVGFVAKLFTYRYFCMQQRLTVKHIYLKIDWQHKNAHQSRMFCECSEPYFSQSFMCLKSRLIFQSCHFPTRYDTGNDGFLDLLELKYMMEKLQAPQTHLGLKTMIAEIDEDNDGKISFREFLMIFK